MDTHLTGLDILKDRLVVSALGDPDWVKAAANAADVRDLLLLQSKPAQPALTCLTIESYRGLKSIGQNNCEVALLDGRSVLALTRFKTFQRTRLRYLLVARSAFRMLALPSINRYLKKGKLRRHPPVLLGGNGKTRVFDVLEIAPDYRGDWILHAPRDLSPPETARRLSHLEGVSLSNVEDEQQPPPYLLRDAELDAAKALFDTRVGTVPIDLYTAEGHEGYCYKLVPSYLPRLAKRMITTSTETEVGIRECDPDHRFIACIFHLIFHEPSRHIPPGHNEIAQDTFANAKVLDHLRACAEAAGRDMPGSFDEMDQILRDADAMPGIDTIGFYAIGNPFVRHRYLRHARAHPGLATYFVRSTGHDTAAVNATRQALQERFTMLAEGPLEGEMRDQVESHIRGGVWIDNGAILAKPVHFFVVHDETPRPPEKDAKAKYVNLDNRNVLEVKVSLRRQQRADPERGALVHATDNSLEALEHLQFLSVGESDVIARYREAFAKSDAL